MNDDKHKLVVSESNETTTNSSHLRDIQETITSKLPNDHFDTIIMVGMLAGIVHYIFTKDTWLLVTFIGLLTGGAIEKSRQINRGNKKVDS